MTRYKVERGVDIPKTPSENIMGGVQGQLRGGRDVKRLGALSMCKGSTTANFFWESTLYGL